MYAYQLGGVRVSFRGCMNSGDLKIRYSIEFVWVMHVTEVDIRPGKASSRKGSKIQLLIANRQNATGAT